MVGATSRWKAVPGLQEQLDRFCVVWKCQLGVIRFVHLQRLLELIVALCFQRRTAVTATSATRTTTTCTTTTRTKTHASDRVHATGTGGHRGWAATRGHCVGDGTGEASG